MSFIGRPKPVPPPQSPPVGIAILRPTTPPGHDRYNTGHFFRGVCICSCAACTLPGGKAVICICPDCYIPACGARSLGGAA